MNDVFDDFKWPRQLGETVTSTWNGEYFEHASGYRSGVIICAESDSNWSDDLTLLHEAEAGEGQHPIDIASRKMAMRSLHTHILNAQGIIMDVGCSSGFLLADIKKTFPQAGLIGADYLTDLLDRLSKKTPGIPLIQFDLRNSPLDDECLDAVTCINVLEHIDDDQKAIEEIYRMLKPGGVAHIEVPSCPSCYDIYDEHLMHHRRYALRELQEKCEIAGFAIMEKTHLGALVFPVFYAVKIRNRKYLNASKEEKKNRVKAMISNTRTSWIMRFLTMLEIKIGKFITYPWGIRCVIIVKKPSNE